MASPRLSVISTVLLYSVFLLCPSKNDFSAFLRILNLDIRDTTASLAYANTFPEFYEVNEDESNESELFYEETIDSLSEAINNKHDKSNSQNRFSDYTYQSSNVSEHIRKNNSKSWSTLGRVMPEGPEHKKNLGSSFKNNTLETKKQALVSIMKSSETSRSALAWPSKYNVPHHIISQFNFIPTAFPIHSDIPTIFKPKVGLAMSGAFMTSETPHAPTSYPVYSDFPTPKRPSPKPSTFPTLTPTAIPIVFNSVEPSGEPTQRPTISPDKKDSNQPSLMVSINPSIMASIKPSIMASSKPTGALSIIPTFVLSLKPSLAVSAKPSAMASTKPTVTPTTQPIVMASTKPTITKSNEPIIMLSEKPTVWVTTKPTITSSAIPTVVATSKPSVAVTTTTTHENTIAEGTLVTFEKVGDTIMGDPTKHNFFGLKVDIANNGRRLAVGGPFGGLGSVLIYEEKKGIWTQFGQTLEGENWASQFGVSFSFTEDGNRIAIGAPFATPHGKVYVYQNDFNAKISEEKWVLVGEAVEGYGANGAGDQFGKSVSLACVKGDQFVAGAGVGLYVQHYKFDEAENKWIQNGEILKVTEVLVDTLAISGVGNFMAVGDPSANERRGEVKIYNLLSKDGFIQIGQTLSGTNPNEKIGFVTSLSRSGTRILIASPFYSIPHAALGGVVRVFEYSKVSAEWKQLGQDIKGSTQVQRLGYSAEISSSGNSIAIGVVENGQKSGYGIFMKYSKKKDAWIQLGENIKDEHKSGFLGWSIAMSGDYATVALGAPLTNGEDDKMGLGLVSVHRMVFPKN